MLLLFLKEGENVFDYDKKVLDVFFAKRNELIDRLENNELNKKDFLLENYLLIENLNMKPFQVLNSIEKCMYNYQYYNVMAKYYRVKINNALNTRKQRRSAEVNKSKISNYYIEKDKVILELLKLVDRENIIAYPVLINSSRINNLIEIVILNYERAILHSINDEVVENLKSKGVFDSTPRLSKIDNYVNSGY